MTDERLVELEQLANAATPGPWWWAEDFFRTKHQRRTTAGNWKAKAGHRSRDTHAMLLLGSRFDGKGPPKEAEYDEANHEHRKYDEFDYKWVIRLSWDQIKGDALTCSTPSPEDAALIAAARTAIPELIAEVRRLRKLEERLTQQSDDDNLLD